MQKMIVVGQEAKSLLENGLFLNAWDTLWEKCPFATVFQHRDFVKTWFKIYPENDPILISDWNGETITGLLAMTFQGKDQISAAGFDQAEYQTWLSMVQASDQFILSAVIALREKFPRKKIHFKYLPSKTPLIGLKKSKKLKGCFFLKAYEQPLLGLSKQHLEAELKKKNRKEKINRLNRLGNLQFNEIQTIEEFKTNIDEMILQSDFRKGSLYDKMIFQTEPNRKEFLLKMFELGHLHVSVLKLDDIIIASNAGFISQDIVHLQGINSHSPFFSKYSPGILLFLMLGIQLGKNGMRYFDLTPGGAEGYKSMLANTTETVHELWISDKKSINLVSAEQKIKSWIKKILIKSKFLKSDFSVLSLSLKNFKRKLQLKMKSGVNFRYLDDLNGVTSNDDKIHFSLNYNKKTNSIDLGNISIRHNYIPDLFAFQEDEQVISRMKLLSDSLRRIELGHRMITVMEMENLSSVFWYIPSSVKNSTNGSLDNSPILSCSFYKREFLKKLPMLFETLRDQIVEKNEILDESLIIEINEKQKQLLNLFKKSGFKINK